MPKQSFNAFRQVQDADAACIAIGAILRVLLETHPVDKERVRALIVTAIADDDRSMRAAWFADWIMGEDMW